jgi:hypothetical protein
MSKLETDPAADPGVNAFDYSSLMAIKWRVVRISEIYTDHITFESKSARRSMKFLLIKIGGKFWLHGQNAAFGPLDLEHLSTSNLIISGDLHRVLRALVTAPTRPKPKRGPYTLPLFPIDRARRPRRDDGG